MADATEPPSERPLRLWVRSEPFVYGILPVIATHKISVKYLRKIVQYARHKAAATFPQIQYSMWRHIACNKLQLAEDLARLYFDTFELLQERPAEQRRRWDGEYARCDDAKERDLFAGQRHVDLLQFVAYLFIQNLSHSGKKQRLGSAVTPPGSDTEWPAARAEPPEAGDRQHKQLEEHQHLSFVQTHLASLVEVLGEGSPLGSVGGDTLVCRAVVEALSILIDLDTGRPSSPPRTGEERPPVTLASVAAEPSRANQTGYVPTADAYQQSRLLRWITGSLGANPYGVAACVSSGRRLSWPSATSTDRRADHKRGKMATNAHVAPPGDKLIVTSAIHKETVARLSPTLCGATLKLHRCHQAFLYFLSPLRNVSIDKCHDTTVALGPVSGTVQLTGCRAVRLVAICRRLVVSDSVGCTLHVTTPTRPLLAGNRNDSLTLAPYHTHYPALEEQMLQAGLGVVPNFWDQPLCLALDGSVGAPPCWRLLEPAAFYPFHTPFPMAGATRRSPGSLPYRYQRVLQERRAKTEQWNKMMAETGLNKEQIAKFQELLRRRFEVWLKETGKQREINSLAACRERTARYEKYKQLAAAAASGAGGGEGEAQDAGR
ncbi:TBCC domain-containing protein 1 [Amphibalanus amphitrite]|uniref:TBCC domain-containing protein 1 n=1 Tax=Amphibalanus amphitrite TaxID=1232801 RepID=A0A6A4WE46_AMPAM|nr:TBCC domain-containing protein 1 [Amphibalanus amphitrite]